LKRKGSIISIGPVGEPPCLDALPGRDVFANDIAGLDSRRMIPACHLDRAKEKAPLQRVRT
jgi:hypothetical protein